ncbi:MAG: CsiV family protein, partial [Pseudomonadales bacterium]
MSTDSRSLRTLGCALTLLAAALVGASSPARAQEEDGSGAPWLQVEVLVFRQLDSSLAGDEAWPSAPDLGYPQDIHILSQPEVPDQSLTAASDSPELLAPEQPFVQLGHGMRALDDAAARIAGSAAYRLLGQFAWRQPAPARGTRSNILLTGGETYADHFELEGSISVTRSRSLQVETRLWLNDFTPLPVPGAQSAGVDLPAVPQPVADLLEP